jgi:hypothetical protein
MISNRCSIEGCAVDDRDRGPNPGSDTLPQMRPGALDTRDRSRRVRTSGLPHTEPEPGTAGTSSHSGATGKVGAGMCRVRQNTHRAPSRRSPATSGRLLTAVTARRAALVTSEPVVLDSETEQRVQDLADQLRETDNNARASRSRTDAVRRRSRRSTTSRVPWSTPTFARRTRTTSSLAFGSRRHPSFTAWSRSRPTRHGHSGTRDGAADLCCTAARTIEAPPSGPGLGVAPGQLHEAGWWARIWQLSSGHLLASAGSDVCRGPASDGTAYPDAKNQRGRPKGGAAGQTLA